MGRAPLTPAELSQCWLAVRTGAAGAFPGGGCHSISAAIEEKKIKNKNLCFHSAFTLRLALLGARSGGEDRSAAGCGLAGLSPLGAQFFPITFVLICLGYFIIIFFFTERALNAFAVSWVISFSINEAYNCVFLTALH